MEINVDSETVAVHFQGAPVEILKLPVTPAATTVVLDGFRINVQGCGATRSAAALHVYPESVEYYSGCRWCYRKLQYLDRSTLEVDGYRFRVYVDFHQHWLPSWPPLHGLHQLRIG